MREEILRIHNGDKQEKETHVLRDIQLEISKGECIGIITDNQHARNTLLNILNGNDCFDHGKIYFDEDRIMLSESQKVFSEKILLIDSYSQKSKELTVEDVIFVLTPGQSNGFYLKRKVCKNVEEVFKSFNISINQKEHVSKLSVLEWFQVQLIKGYINNFSIVVLVDISHVLNDEDRKKVMELVVQMRMYGMAFFMVENNEKILFEYVDKINVLSQGRSNYILEQDEFEISTLHKVLIGSRRRVERTEKYKKNRMLFNSKKEVLNISKVSTKMLKDVSFSVYAGEIVSLVCVDSYQGQDIIELLKGDIQDYEGTITLNHQIYYPKDIHGAMERDICFVEENPSKRGKLLFYNMSVMDNLTLIMAQKTKNIIMRKRYERSIIKESKEFFDESIFSKSIRELSTVERQKLAYFKWYLYNPELVICNQPLAGTDIFMRQITEEMIQKFAKKGIAVLVITSNLSVANEIGDRVILIKNGEIIDNY